ncbi:hypothetical protein CR513_02520, partial [Mucuna pruriens]
MSHYPHLHNYSLSRWTDLLGRPTNALAWLTGCPSFLLSFTGAECKCKRAWARRPADTQPLKLLIVGEKLAFLLMSLSTTFRPQPSPTSSGSHSDGSSGSSNPGSSSARGNETQHSATLTAGEEFPFTILFREAQESDLEGLPSWIDLRVSRVNSIYTCSKSLVGMADAICRRGPWLVEVLPCRLDEIVCEWAVDTFFYLYETLFLKLGIKLLFTDFEQATL